MAAYRGTRRAIDSIAIADPAAADPDGDEPASYPPTGSAPPTVASPVLLPYGSRIPKHRASCQLLTIHAAGTVALRWQAAQGTRGSVAPPSVRGHRSRMTTLTNFLGEKRLLVEEITTEYRSGVAAAAIAGRVSAAFEREQVIQYLTAVKIRDVADAGLREACLSAVARCWVTGIDPPREARLALSADPGEHTGYDLLPAAVEAALRRVGLTLTAAAGESANDLLRDGESVRVVPADPTH